VAGIEGVPVLRTNHPICSTSAVGRADVCGRGCQVVSVLVLMSSDMADTGPLTAPTADLVERIARGDRDAFALFYDRHAGLVLGLARRILRNDAAADEVLQEVFWQVWQDAGQYDSRRGSPEAWLVMRARTRAIDRLRSMRRRERTFVAPLDEGLARSDAAGAESPATLAEDRGLVHGALGQLPAAQRRVIELAFFEGLTQTEIAAHLGEPLGTVKTRARMGLERLREFLRGEEQAAR
jgi:RNA polymerase sigma-70 factor, ECF subfamily